MNAFDPDQPPSSLEPADASHPPRPQTATIIWFGLYAMWFVLLLTVCVAVAIWDSGEQTLFQLYLGTVEAMVGLLSGYAALASGRLRWLALPAVTAIGLFSAWFTDNGWYEWMTFTHLIGVSVFGVGLLLLPGRGLTLRAVVLRQALARDPHDALDARLRPVVAIGELDERAA